MQTNQLPKKKKWLLSNHQLKQVWEKEEKMNDEIKASAEGHFKNGLMCAESVVVTITMAHGIESELLPKAATAFCGGMSRTCGTCGALSGAVMGISAILGREEAGEPYDAPFQAAATVINNFEEEFGGRNCQELLGCDLGTVEGQKIFRENRLYERCLTYTGRAAELAEEILKEIKA
jgi:C_GCAxxG_C_C family probable redox protein